MVFILKSQPDAGTRHINRHFLCSTFLVYFSSDYNVEIKECKNSKNCEIQRIGEIQRTMEIQRLMKFKRLWKFKKLRTLKDCGYSKLFGNLVVARQGAQSLILCLAGVKLDDKNLRD